MIILQQNIVVVNIVQQNNVKKLKWERIQKMNYDLISDRLKNLREEKGLSQSKVGELLGLKQQTITKLEHGTQKLTDEIIYNYAKSFNVPADYILGLTDVKTLNKDIQFICDYSGLSADAVRVLSEYIDYDKGESNVLASLNKLIEGAKELPSERFFNVIGELPEQRNIDLREEDAEYNKKSRNNVLIDIATFLGYEIQEEKTFSIDYWGGVQEGTNPFSDLRNIVTNKELFNRIMLDRIAEKLKALQEDFSKCRQLKMPKNSDREI